MNKRELSLPGITVFNRFAREYDHWFVENSFAYLLGRNYESMKDSIRFYKWATFYSVSQLMDVLTAVGFSDFQVCQTLFTNPGDMVRCDPVCEGHGEGSFVVLMGTRHPA